MAGSSPVRLHWRVRQRDVDTGEGPRGYRRYLRDASSAEPHGPDYRSQRFSQSITVHNGYPVTHTDLDVFLCVGTAGAPSQIFDLQDAPWRPRDPLTAMAM